MRVVAQSDLRIFFIDLLVVDEIDKPY